MIKTRGVRLGFALCLVKRHESALFSNVALCSGKQVYKGVCLSGKQATRYITRNNPIENGRFGEAKIVFDKDGDALHVQWNIK